MSTTTREQQIARRAVQLLEAGSGVTAKYALAAVEAELVDADDLRGHRTELGKRWFLA